MNTPLRDRLRLGIPLTAAILLALSGASCNDRTTDRSDPLALTPYIYVQDSSEQKGGMSATFTTTYLSADGIGQLAEEETDDVVRELRTSTVCPEAFFKDLSNLRLPEQRAPEGGVRPPGNLVTEYAPPSFYVEIGDREGRLRSWLGRRADLPTDLATVISQASKLIKSGDRFGIHTGKRYIRATILTKMAASDMKEAGVLREVSRNDLRQAPLIHRAITHPRMLVAVGDEDPYGKLGRFAQGRSVAISIDKSAFQVRNLLKVGAPERKGTDD